MGFHESVPPTRTPAERAEAREIALQRRRQRAQFRDDLAAGKYEIADVVRRGKSGDPVIGGTLVEVVLRCVPAIGPVKARQIMQHVKISPTRRMRGLGQRQQVELVTAVEQRQAISKHWRRVKGLPPR